MKKRMILARLGMAALLLLATAAAVPQQAGNRYTVEIVVFRHGGQAGALSGNETDQAALGDDVEPTTITARRLATSASRLRSARGYRVLAHTAWTQAPAAWNSRRGVSVARLGLAGTGITGKVGVERGTYLNLRIDLTVDDGGRRYHISDVRRVKPDEAQYFDHPAFGVIAVVSAGG